MSLLDNLNWRYATKKMTGEKIPDEKLEYILEAARLAPSSVGIQPYKIFVISDTSLKAQIRAIAFDQSQITDCSHLLVFAAWDQYDRQRISGIFDRTVKERDLPADALDALKERQISFYDSLGKEWQTHHIAKQSYISLGFALMAAAEQKLMPHLWRAFRATH